MKRLLKISSILSFFLSLIILFYIFYKAQIVNHGIRTDYYIKYYIISFILITITSFSFFLSDKIRIYAIFSLFFLTFFLYSAEFIFTLQANFSEKNKTAQKILKHKIGIGETFDTRTWFDVYRDIKKKDPSIFFETRLNSLSQDHNLKYLPLSGLSNKRTLMRCNDNGFYPIYQSDRYGFNNPDKEWDATEIEYLLIGDSTILGYCVNQSNTISANLRKLSNLDKNKNGVLNLGVGGIESLHEYAILKEYFPTKKVKRVLWFFFESDLEELNSELNNKILIKYLEDEDFTQNVISKKGLSEEILFKKLRSVIKQQSTSYKILRFLKLTQIRNKISIKSSSLIDSENLPIKKFYQIIDAANNFTLSNKSKFYFIYIPMPKNHINKKSNTVIPSYKKVIEVVKSLNIPIIDLTEELLVNHPKPLSLYPLLYQDHLNELGHEEASNIVYKKIYEFENN